METPNVGTSMPRNITNRFSEWTTELIADHLADTAHPVAVLMENWQGDFNFGTMVRNANAFNVEQVFYLGKRKWDRRGAVGTHHYTNVTHLEDGDALDEAIVQGGWTPVAIDNAPGAEPLFDFEFPERPLLMFGEEAIGLTPETIARAESMLAIPQWGSVRSLNAGVSSGIIMYEWARQHADVNAAFLDPTHA